MRIVGGILKSRRFSVPKSFPSRPTTDFAKEGLFNMLEHSIDLENLNILDLCAGTGNITFEFASREAGKITAIDQHAQCCKFIQQHAKDFGLEEIITVVKNEVIAFINRTNERFDLIFIDPPYESPIYKGLPELVFSKEILKENGLLIIEHGKQTSFEVHPYFTKMKKFGNVHFSFFER